jgi:hypothetical protein
MEIVSVVKLAQRLDTCKTLGVLSNLCQPANKRGTGVYAYRLARNCGRTFPKQLHPVFKVLIILVVLLVFIVLYLYIEKFIDVTRNPFNLLPIPAQELIV